MGGSQVMADVDPWERQPGESTVAHAAFVAYRDAGVQRSIRKTAGEIGKHRTLLEDWSKRHSWVVRAAAWDAEQDRLWRAEVATRRRDMALRQARIAAAMQSKIVARLQSIKPEDLSPQQLAGWLQIATQVERLALGEPTARNELTGAGGGPIEADVTVLTPEERIARLDQLRREIERRTGEARPDAEAS